MPGKGLDSKMERATGGRQAQAPGAVSRNSEGGKTARDVGLRSTQCGVTLEAEGRPPRPVGSGEAPAHHSLFVAAAEKQSLCPPGEGHDLARPASCLSCVVTAPDGAT